MAGFFTIYLSGEHQSFFEKIPSRKRSQWVQARIQEELDMDEAKLLRQIEGLEEEIADKKETLRLLRQSKTTLEESIKIQEEKDRLRKSRTLAEIQADCPICQHPQKTEIEAMITKMESEKTGTKPIREAFGFSASAIICHQGEKNADS